MPPKHGPWRSPVVLHDVAEQQIDTMTDTEREVLDPQTVRLHASAGTRTTCAL
ncbi:hypothetical protein [Streptomyces sp. NPDC001774]